MVKTLIYNHNFDKECVEHWLDNPNSQIRVQAALLTEDGKVDEVLARLNPQDVAHVLADEPQWATCERGHERLGERGRGGTLQTGQGHARHAGLVHQSGVQERRVHGLA